jgi:hypothetical protein
MAITLDNYNNEMFKYILHDNPTIIEEIKKVCPNITLDTINQIDRDILKDILENTYGKSLESIMLDKMLEDQIKLFGGGNPGNPANPGNSIVPIKPQLSEEDHILEENYKLGYENIPEMYLPSDLIFLNGKINNIPVKILFDTGAGINTIKKSVVEKAGLDYLIDKKSQVNIVGVNSVKKSYGEIWYTEMELQLNKLNTQSSYATIGVTFSVISGDNSDSDSNIDIILGIKFMKSYGTVIDFSSRTITINKTIKINFD